MPVRIKNVPIQWKVTVLLIVVTLICIIAFFTFFARSIQGDCADKDANDIYTVCKNGEWVVKN